MARIALIDGILLDGSEHMEPQKEKVILIERGKIKAVEDKGCDLSDYDVYDLEGKYIMPGLINMHVHLAGNGSHPKKQRDNTKLVNLLFSNPLTKAIAYQLVRSFAKTELLSGVTTIRTVGGLKDFDTRVRDEINSGRADGPRILAANTGISVPHGHMAGSVAIPAETIEQALDQVEHNAREGVDLIKLMITGGVMDAVKKGAPGVLKMKPEMIRAVCEKAHQKGYLVAAHCEGPEGVKEALKNGVDSIEHGAKPDLESIALFKETGAFLTTTLSPALPYALFDRSISYASEVEQFNGKVVFEGIRDASKAALENGIPVALGNDVGCPWITQYDFWRELYWFHKFVGVSNTFALYTATKRNAELAGLGEITGSIEPGKSADLIVTSQNPLEDLQALRHVETVIMRGKIYDHPEIKRKKDVDEQLDKFL